MTPDAFVAHCHKAVSTFSRIYGRPPGIGESVIAPSTHRVTRSGGDRPYTCVACWTTFASGRAPAHHAVREA